MQKLGGEREANPVPGILGRRREKGCSKGGISSGNGALLFYLRDGLLLTGVLAGAAAAIVLGIGGLAKNCNDGARERKERFKALTAEVEGECDALKRGGGKKLDSGGERHEIAGCRMEYSDFLGDGGWIVLNIRIRSGSLRGIEREISYYYGCKEDMWGTGQRGMGTPFGKRLPGICLGAEKRSWHKKGIRDTEIPKRSGYFRGGGRRNAWKKQGAYAPRKLLRASKR